MDYFVLCPPNAEFSFFLIFLFDPTTSLPQYHVQPTSLVVPVVGYIVETPKRTLHMLTSEVTQPHLNDSVLDKHLS